MYLSNALGAFVTISLRKINVRMIMRMIMVNKMIMVCHSLNNNARTGLVISLCLNANPLISLIPPNGLKF